MNQAEHMMKAARGEIVDVLPYAPRIDLWYLANQARGNLPKPYHHLSVDDLARAQGWGLHKIILEYQEHGLEAIIDRCLGVYRLPQQGFIVKLPDTIRRDVSNRGQDTDVVYTTPVGTVRGVFRSTPEMVKKGITIPWIKEHLLKTEDDFRPLSYIFANLIVEPSYPAFSDWFRPFENDTIAVAYALTAGSPRHHVLKILSDPKQFFLLSEDHSNLMQALDEALGEYFGKVLAISAKSPAPVVLVGANFDATITYPRFFNEHILPWLQRAADTLHGENKLMLCHTDGENMGLMGYLYESGMDIAEAVCPAPMTKVDIADYYRNWSDRITIFGGIPSNVLLPDTCSNDEFEAYLDHLLEAIAPGQRFIVGVADTTPPDAPFGRLVRIGEKLQKCGQLPLKAGVFNPVSEEQIAAPRKRSSSETVRESHGSTGSTAARMGEERLQLLLGKACDELVRTSSQLNNLYSALRAVLNQFGSGDQIQNSETKKESPDAKKQQQDSEQALKDTPLDDLARVVLRGDHNKASEKVLNLLALGFDSDEILQGGLLKAMEIIGSRFRDGTVFIPEVLLSARAMNAAVKLLKPKSPQENNAARGHILIGTVKGDFHDIGKNLVITMLRGVGHEVEDLGIDVPCERFVDCVREKRPQILGLSALLTTTMPEMKKIVDVLKASGLPNQVKVIVGGAPVNQHFASQIGADGYAQNAGQSVTLVKSLLNEKC